MAEAARAHLPPAERVCFFRIFQGAASLCLPNRLSLHKALQGLGFWDILTPLVTRNHVGFIVLGLRGSGSIGRKIERA